MSRSLRMRRDREWERRVRFSGTALGKVRRGGE